MEEVSATPEEQVSITAFHSDAMVSESKMVSLKTIDPSLLNNATLSAEPTLKSFLERPILLDSDVLASTDSSSTFAQFVLPQAALSNAMYSDKFTGYLGFRADMTVRLVVNANRFQQGRYILAWAPMCGASVAHSAIVTNGRFANLTTITQLPHVEIDLATMTEATLHIPYVSVTSHISTDSNNADAILGILKLFPYSPLVSVAGSTTAPFDLYFNFSNLHLAAPNVPQSAKFKPRTKTETEQSEAGIGPISGIATKVTTVANIVGKKVPLLSGLADTVSWASQLIGDVAHVFGFSRPLVLEHTYRTVQGGWWYAANCDMPDNSQNLALTGRNEVEILPGFAGNDLDEMSLDFIKSVPAFFLDTSWSTTLVPGDMLFSIPIVPKNFETSFVSGVSTVYCQAPVAYLCNYFQSYRGGLRFILKIVKTEFHSGRLAISFNPYDYSNVGTSISGTNQFWIHRDIIDIRSGEVIDFIVPYVSLTPYRQVDQAAGELRISVVNPLVAPATVASTIQLLLEVAAAPDFEYAVPIESTRFYPVTVYNPQSGRFVPKNDQTAIVQKVIGGAMIHDDEHVSARSCIGEKILSVNQLLKRFTYMSDAPSAIFTLDPYEINIGHTAALTTTTATTWDTYNSIAPCFAMVRGGMRVKVGVGLTAWWSRMLFKKRSTTYRGIATTTLENRGSFPGHWSSNAVMEIQVPHYSDTHSRSTVIVTTDGSLLTNDPRPLGGSQYALVGQVSSGTPGFFRAAADDFQLGLFVGVLPIVYV